MADINLTGSTTCTGRIAGALTGEWSLGGGTRAGGQGFLTSGLQADQDLEGSESPQGRISGDIGVDVDVRGSESPGGRLSGDLGVDVDIAGSVIATGTGALQLTGARSQTPLRVVGQQLEAGIVIGHKWGGDVLPIEVSSAPPVATPADGKGVVFQDNGRIWIWGGSAWQQASLEDEALVTNFDRIDETTSYIGEAEPGTATSAATWRIRKMVENAEGDVTITYADGNANFDNVWDNRASLSYS